MRDWRDIWEARELELSTESTLAALMKADGLDTGFGDMSEHSWRDFVKQTAEALGITPTSSVFEVGCGAGAFLYDLARNGCRVGGSDISSTQIRHIRQIIPSGIWTAEAAIETTAEVPYDFVVAMGVFMYFPSHEYAFEVLRRMSLKAVHAIAVLDIPDASRQSEAIRFRQGTLGDEEYAKRYAGLDHLYIDRQWVERSLRKLGFARWTIQDQRIEGYSNSAFRFNAFAWRAMS